MNGLTASLQQRFPNRQPLVVPRGITALYLAMLLIRDKHGPGEVVLPATVCPSVALAVAYAGLVPRFCDVAPETFCMSPGTVEKVLSSETRAILCVYMFGKIFDVNAMVQLAQDAGLEIVEDLALSVGGTHAGSPVGQFGDYTVLSFNNAKILPGAAGVLMLKRADELNEAQQHYLELPPPPPPESARELSVSFRNLTHGWYDLMRYGGLKEANTWLSLYQHQYRDLFLYRRELTEVDEIQCIQSLDELPEILRRRRNFYLKYQELLDDDVPFVRFTASEACWRLPVLLASHRQQLRLLEMIRSAGLLVSNHYFPVSYLWGDDQTVTARDIGLRAVNFWVDGTAKQSDVKTICRLTNEVYHGE